MQFNVLLLLTVTVGLYSVREDVGCGAAAPAEKLNPADCILLEKDADLTKECLEQISKHVVVGGILTEVCDHKTTKVACSHYRKLPCAESPLTEDGKDSKMLCSLQLCNQVCHKEEELDACIGKEKCHNETTGVLKCVLNSAEDYYPNHMQAQCPLIKVKDEGEWSLLDPRIKVCLREIVHMDLESACAHGVCAGYEETEKCEESKPIRTDFDTKMLCLAKYCNKICAEESSKLDCKMGCVGDVHQVCTDKKDEERVKCHIEGALKYKVTDATLTTTTTPKKEGLKDFACRLGQLGLKSLLTIVLVVTLAANSFFG